MALLDKISDFNFLKKSDNKSVLGIDIGETSIKVVQLRKDEGTAVLETYGEIALGPYANLEIGQSVQPTVDQTVAALSDLIKEANVTTKSCGASIPFSSSLISVIQMPKLDKKQLAKMIPIEARKYIPVPVSEVTLDWFVIPKEEKVESFDSDEEKDTVQDSKINILLVAIHNEVLSQYREIMRAAGLELSFYEIEIFSTIRSILGRNLKPALVIDIGASTTKLFIVEFGIVKMSHVISRGSQTITRTLARSLQLSQTEAETLKRKVGIADPVDHKEVTDASLLVLTDIFAEVNRVLLQFQKQYNKNVGQVYLTGGGSALKGVLSFTSQHLETEVILGDPFSKVESPSFLEDVLKEVGPDFSVAVGLALRKLQETE